MKRKQQSGFTLIEVIASTTIMLIGMVGALAIFKNMTRDTMVSDTAVMGDQVEQLLKNTVYRRIQNYLYAVAETDRLGPPAFVGPKCINTNLPASDQFISVMNRSTPEGFALTYMNANVRNHVYTLINGSGTDGSRATPLLALTQLGASGTAVAVPRCPHDTFGHTQDLNAEKGLYFCVQLTSSNPNSLTTGDMRADASKPMFAEIRFVTTEAATGAVLNCNQLSAFMNYPSATYRRGASVTPDTSKQGQIIGTLFYKLYWGGAGPKGPIYKYRTGTVTQSWAW